MSKKKEEVLCSYDPQSKEMTLCEGMDVLAVRGIPAGGKIKPGLYIATNMVHMPTFEFINRGPRIYGRDGKWSPLVCCPWCQSDLVHNWHKPVQEWFEKKHGAIDRLKKGA